MNKRKTLSLGRVFLVGGLCLILFFIFLRTSIVSEYRVPRGNISMRPLLSEGDRFYVYKAAYNFRLPFTDYVVFNFSKPKYGDVIVFKSPIIPDQLLVKRVVGVAGDELKIIDDVIYINDIEQGLTKLVDSYNTGNNEESLEEEVEDTYLENVKDKEYWVILSNDPNKRLMSNWPITGEPYKVPLGTVFVIGDNRNNSLDSRSWGGIPLSSVIGKLSGEY